MTCSEIQDLPVWASGVNSVLDDLSDFEASSISSGKRPGAPFLMQRESLNIQAVEKLCAPHSLAALSIMNLFPQ